MRRLSISKRAGLCSSLLILSFGAAFVGASSRIRSDSLPAAVSSTSVSTANSSEQKRRAHQHVGNAANVFDAQSSVGEKIRTSPASLQPPSAEDTVAAKQQPTATRPILSTPDLLSCISFLTGVANVICHRTHGCMCAMATGNVISAASAVAECRWFDAVRFSRLVGCYGTGAAVWRILQSALSPASVAVAAATTIALGLLFVSDVSSSAPPLALAFGIINGCATASTGGTITFAQTGHVTTLGRTCADSFLSMIRQVDKAENHGDSAASAAAVPKAVKSMRVISGFGSGIATATLVSASPKFTNTLSKCIRHPFATIGLACSTFLILGGVKVNVKKNTTCSSSRTREKSRQNSLAEAEKVMSTHLDLYVRQRSSMLKSKAAKDIRLDGWTKMPSGPHQFEDGSE